jgi:hypothetical protein
MSFPTKPAYIVDSCNGWESQYLEHPAFAWMYDYETSFDHGDMKSGPHTPWHTDDFTFTKPTGESASGEAGWAALLETYAPLTEHFHEPRWFLIWETTTGYKLTGCAIMYGNLPVPGEKKHKDLKGKEWDFAGPGMFQFEFVHDASGPKGLKLKAESICADATPLVGEIVKRGMATPAEVFAKLG